MMLDEFFRGVGCAVLGLSVEVLSRAECTISNANGSSSMPVFCCGQHRPAVEWYYLAVKRWHLAVERLANDICHRRSALLRSTSLTSPKGLPPVLPL